MVEAVGDVEGELVIGAVFLCTPLDGAVDVDDEVAAEPAAFAGDGVVAEANDVGWTRLAEVFQVGGNDSFVVGQDNADLVPRFSRAALKLAGQPVSQLLEPVQVERVLCLLV